VTGAELIADIINWKLYLLALLVHGIAPGLLLRVIVLAFDDPDRRQELIAELYAVPFIQRPLWVAQQLETALSDGIWPRFMWMLTGRVIYRWKLIDAAKSGRTEPVWNWLPGLPRDADVRPGDAVKLAFTPSMYPPGSHGICEWMWVLVTKVDNRGLQGTIDNFPAYTPRLEYGDRIKFKHKHIVAIKYDVLGGNDAEPAVVDAA
jgi:hypothetical protein